MKDYMKEYINEIDKKIRYRWLYQLTKHIGNVKIIFIEDKSTR